MSQLEDIRQHLLSGKTLTPIEALNKYGCFRLGARVYDLRKKEGLNIEDVGEKNYAEYKLIQEQNFPTDLFSEVTN
jgi:hypothetical protein